MASTPPFGSVRCPQCKGTGLSKYTDGACQQCEGEGWLTPDRQRTMMPTPRREDHQKDAQPGRPQGGLRPLEPLQPTERSRRMTPPPPPPEGRNVVLDASDAIVPIVQDNEFSRRTLEKVLRSKRDKTMRRLILEHLHGIWPNGLSSSQMEATYGWLHQSCSSTMTTLHQHGLLSIIGERTNARGNPEGIYALSAKAKGAWDDA